MYMTRASLYVFAALCSFLLVNAGTTEGGTELSLVGVFAGYVNITTSGVGLGGTDQFQNCQNTITKQINLPWGYDNVTIRRAYLIYQVSTNGDATAFSLKLDGQAAAPTLLTSGTVCSKKLKRAYGLYADATAIVKSKLEGTTASVVTFSIVFENNCKKNMSLANGVSLLVIPEGVKGGKIPYGIIQLQLGAFAYDVKFNKEAMTAIFQIPAVGVNPTQRVGKSVVGFYDFIGESELYANETEGFYINDVQTDLKLNGNTGEDWESSKIDVTKILAKTDTKLNITLFSSLDCHIFIGLALQYEVNDPSNNASGVGEDPHAVTWDGVYMTLAEEGDFILAESASTGLVVHGRFCKARSGPWAPWTCAVAIRCSANAGTMVFDAVLGIRNPIINGLADAYIHTDQSVVTVRCWSSGVILKMTHEVFHRHNYINLNMERDVASLAADIRGVLGTPNGNAEDDFEFRDGSIWRPAHHDAHYIGQSLKAISDLQMSWQVKSHETIFPTAFVPTPTLVSTFSVSAARQRRPLAEQACIAAGIVGTKNLKICVHDVVLTGSTAGVEALARWLKG
mmetsp:Transcript_6717/g.11550  ORF Transcript_6717/g.11550 Transcript_6717/m.11550 type:complete len:567 (-) Transcript_6717:1585-3285(-)|eukprot:CAMPEP_0196657946 /NCGR_PEP_ID=MMETSP1086-20130531/26415_1 /TAXON_ID=77921 /ORGANISM="Cyanoptyche  gloeocystis , Strain SAG4.97" /LENGTH=566 /DNA_ID=CAMNT_0041991271 /DNA_START=35 /DNA_END=1735 /DNA_ORIENTATION=-